MIINNYLEQLNDIASKINGLAEDLERQAQQLVEENPNEQNQDMATDSVAAIFFAKNLRSITENMSSYYLERLSKQP